MPALILLATGDDRLAAAWERQIPRGWPSVRLQAPDWPASISPGAPAVLVLEASAHERVARSLQRLPTVWVGDLPALLRDAPKAVLSVEESQRRLGEVLPLLDQLAEQQAMIDLLTEKCRRADGAAPAAPAAAGESGDAAAVWELFEAAWEQLDQPELLQAEFRRAARVLLQASEARLFLADGAHYRADRGSAFIRSDDPVVRRLDRHPYPVDAEVWEPGGDPGEEAAVRSRMAQWGARLLAPIAGGGRLRGWIALGPRRDGRPYTEGDRRRAARLARLLGRGLQSPPSLPGTADEGALLREIGLTLAHELGNALVPLSALRQWEGDTPPAPVLAAVRHEIAELEQLHREIGRLQELDAYPFESIDLREVVAQLGADLSCPAEVGADPVEISVAIPLIRYALRTLVRAASPKAVLQLRSVPAPGGSVALLSVRGAEMELSGLLPETQRPGVPNQGRLAVFLAKEIIGLHGGEIRLGPGPVGSELLIALRSRR